VGGCGCGYNARIDEFSCVSVFVGGCVDGWVWERVRVCVRVCVRVRVCACLAKKCRK